jgi:hypothetical protein
MASLGGVTRDDRSQPLLRVPRDKTPAELILDDGERCYALLFVPPGDRISRVIDEPNAFVPVIVSSVTRLLARKAIACMTVHVLHAAVDEDMPEEKQRVAIRLRGGITVRGELRWIAPPDRRRTLDHLNDASSHLVVHEGDYVHYIAKSTVLGLEEV